MNIEYCVVVRFRSIFFYLQVAKSDMFTDLTLFLPVSNAEFWLVWVGLVLMASSWRMASSRDQLFLRFHETVQCGAPCAERRIASQESKDKDT